MKRKNVIRAVIIAVAVIVLLGAVHVSVNYGPAIIRSIRQMHGM